MEVSESHMERVKISIATILMKHTLPEYTSNMFNIVLQNGVTI